MVKWSIVFFVLIHLQLSAVISDRVIICTICRDVSSYLPEMISQVEKIGALFQDYRVVVYENNSQDDTPSQLCRWKRSNPKVSVEVEFLSDVALEAMIVNMTEGKLSRGEQRAIARNKALTIALSQFGEEFSCVFWMDATVKLQSIEEIINIFSKSQDWDAVFAYGVDATGNFQDWFAFRDVCLSFGPELIGDAWYIEPKQFILSQNDPWYPVYSAFGGCAIYKRHALQDCRYNALVSQSLEAAVRRWFFWGLDQQCPSIHRYLQGLEGIDHLVYIECPHPNLPQLPKNNHGIYISKEPLIVVWKNHGTFHQYPEVCEHVSLHASMYCRGYQRLFIDPNFVCVERDNHYASHPNQD